MIGLALISPVSAGATYSAGLITPDSPLWALDLKMEEITESLMLTDDARVNLQLKHANERISEMTLFPGNERATEEYKKVLSRIENAQNLRYETTTTIQARLEAHREIMMSISDDSAQIQTSDSAQIQTSVIIQELSQAQSAIEDKTRTLISEEAVWWSEKIAEYNILSSPTLVENYGDFERYTTQLQEGVTVVDVVRSDDTLLESYIIRKENGAVTIQTGTTENYVNKYIVTINELKRYESLL
jgi:hypothetical protein